ncbi:MAG: hypothetical protein JO153_02015 [Solirubrobacterales bacterium]|nr:hypothetical protein [Solirubrobacterales bacterium]
MRMALVGITGAEPSLASWRVLLDRAGAPYEVLALEHPAGPRRLLAGMRSARFQALIVANAELPEVALSSAERDELAALEAAFGIRRLVSYAYPQAALGLRAPVWAGRLDGLEARLTRGGRRVFPYLRSLELDCDTWGYLASPVSAARFELLLAAPDGSALLGVHRDGDGRETMVQTFAASPTQRHALLLRFGQLAWLSRGAHLGFERNYLPLHVDDVLLGNHSWDLTTHSSCADPRAAIRMTAEDGVYAARWARARGLRLDLVCNGHGSERHRTEAGVPEDGLLDALLRYRQRFGWINHTYAHRNLDAAPRSVIEDEIKRNIAWARRFGIELEPDALVTGEHSGLANLGTTPERAENPELRSALREVGVRYIACDASRPYRTAGAPAASEIAPGLPFAIGPALAIPRHPTALPFDAATKEQAIDRWRSSERDDASAPWEELVRAEAARIFIAMLSNDPRPHYFHQSNLVTATHGASPEGGLLYELIDAVLDRYERFVLDMPIVQPTLGAIGGLIQDRAAWGAARAAGSVVAYREQSAVRIENRSSSAVPVPLTGVQGGTRYGAARSGWVLAEPGKTVVALARSPAAARAA